MKICYVSSVLSIHDIRFFDKFLERNYKVDVVSFNNNRPDKHRHGITYHNFPISGHNKLSTSINIAKSIIFLKKLLRKINPDVLHGGFIQMDGFISALTNYHPFLLMPWGSDVLILPKKSILSKIFAKYTIQKADMITCDAEFVKKAIIKLKNYPEDKIIVFPYGIDLKKFNPNVDGSKIRTKLGWNDKKILIMTRFFKPIYGIEYFLNAFVDIIHEIPEVRVILCGDGPLKNNYLKFVSENNLNEYVFFAGHVQNDELPNYLNAADIYVSSSLSDGTSLSLLEAMACGLPTIVTDVPAIMEWVQDGKNGFVVPRKDSVILAEKIIQMLQDETLQKNFGNENIKIAKERADWDKNFGKLERIYKSLI